MGEENLDWLKSVLGREMEVDDEGKLFQYELMGESSDCGITKAGVTSIV